MQKVACSKCGTLVLPTTAQKTGGVCMPCSTGTREAIEQAKSRAREERARDGNDPERLLWSSLVERVHDPAGGIHTLSEPEKKYFVAHILVGEVHNGGFDQFFHNHSGEYYTLTAQTLMELGALQSLRLLRQAKKILFADHEVPQHTPTRREYLARHPLKDEEPLDELDREFWADPDALYEKLFDFATKHGLFGVVT